jgi:photosystem II stability/assembly factor-like uncharacterized protein
VSEYVADAVAFDNRLFVSTIHALWLSSDDGTKWSKVDNRGGERIQIVTLDNKLFVTSCGALFMISNNGTTWRMLDVRSDEAKTLPFNPDAARNVRQVVAVDNRLFVATLDIVEQGRRRDGKRHPSRCL